jgi:Signal peptidase, peptidase S26
MKLILDSLSPTRIIIIRKQFVGKFRPETLKRGDIVTVCKPDTEIPLFLVKRIVGLPGDVIQCKPHSADYNNVHRIQR